MMLVAAAVKVMIAVTIPAGGSQDVAALLWLVLLVPQCLWLCVADGVVAVAAGIAQYETGAHAVVAGVSCVL